MKMMNKKLVDHRRDAYGTKRQTHNIPRRCASSRERRTYDLTSRELIASS